MNKCYFCGAELDKDDAFCLECGATVEAPRKVKVKAVNKRERMNKLSCELAYTGTLFWLPLLVCPNEKYAKYCANQGLWILILSVFACWTIRILDTLNNLVNGTIGRIFSGGIYSLSYMLFLFLMTYLLVQCIKNALAFHRDQWPKPILFFEDYAIIK
ncbi:hypothetical protein BAU15_10315 [Enterococcus sp. JM4C]|uniref:hypothetical protein n=1 Tax=Candidatus Enterococcus huntleyi TaxID=1857217 RepID=UPI00137B8589|nr:hypothetical protein [Enterococcus sp. JM4C]KAF1296174.1 hypothetical protein BAU15_10315 [Enterococcus sp. JM4C]